MTRAAFDAQMRRMVGLRFAPPVLDTHWEGLQGVPLEALTKAVTHAIISRRDFPTPAELREDIDRITPAQESAPLGRGSENLDQPIPLGQLPDGTRLPAATRIWHYYCETCSDCGWEPVWCGEGRSPFPWVTVQMDCGRYHEHAAHEFSRRCGCWDSNPELIRKRETQRKFAAQRTEKGRKASPDPSAWLKG